MRNIYSAKLKEKLREALQAVLPIMALVLVLCFSVAPISPSILLCFLLGGGTVIHAKGTGMEAAQKFLGFSLASEKEIVLMVAASEKKNDIMRAVMDQCGLNADAKAVTFSLPVTATAGMRLMEPEAEDNGEL